MYKNKKFCETKEFAEAINVAIEKDDTFSKEFENIEKDKIKGKQRLKVISILSNVLCCILLALQVICFCMFIRELHGLPVLLNVGNYSLISLIICVLIVVICYSKRSYTLNFWINMTDKEIGLYYKARKISANLE